MSSTTSRIAMRLILAMCVSGAHLTYADTFLFTLTSSSGPSHTITFELSSAPTPGVCVGLFAANTGVSCFGVNTPITVDGVTGSGVAEFFTPAVGGGLVISSGSTLLINQFGPGGNGQLFSGTLTNPLFS